MALQTGDKCPSFTLPDQNGAPFHIDDLIGKKLLVIYFYPKDETGGCTAEACSFRDNYEDFSALGCEVIGISGDGIASHEKFAAKHRLNFTLLADTKKEVHKLFGVSGSLFGLLPARMTFIIDKTGTIRSTHNSLSDPQGHVKAARQAIETLAKSTI
jgi:thioredoxin-dependent peroxiredoxin